MTTQSAGAVRNAGYEESARGRVFRLRWWILGVLSLSLIIVGLDNTVLNVALPTLQREFNASASSLQWIVDAYIVVFAGLLLAAGALGDKFGRKKALQAGMLVIGIGSVAAAFSQSAGELIAARAVIGTGAAFVMPATLSIIVDVFPKEERTKAIATWASVSMIGIVIGPVLGGWLLENMWWGAIFLIHGPFVAASLIGGWLLVPESRNANATRLDIRSGLLSIGALSALVFAIIEAPSHGILDVRVMIAGAAAPVLGTIFTLRQLRIPNPLLDMGLFRNRQFSSSVGPIAIVSLGLGGVGLLMTQFLQIVQGYGPFEAGLRMFVPVVIGYVLGASLSPKIEAGYGTRRVMVVGLALAAVFSAAFVASTPDTSYYVVAAGLIGITFGMGLTIAPATSAVMGAVPGGNAGVGSAVNDATREIGTALGIGIMGSVANTVFFSGMSDAVTGLPAEAAAVAQDSVGGALTVAAQLEAAAGQALASAGTASFMDALGITFAVAGAMTAIGAVAVLRFMPERASTAEEEVSMPIPEPARPALVAEPIPAGD